MPPPTTVPWGIPAVLRDESGLPMAAPQGGALAAAQANVVSTVNSSTTLLLANAVFTGTSESTLGYAAISVSAFSDQASATNGLSIQQSQDGTNWDVTDTFSVTGASAGRLTVPVVANFYRVVYTNGSVNQATFRLQSVKMTSPLATAVGGSRAAYYDRHQTTAYQDLDTGAIAPAGATVQWTYTVPATKKAMLESGTVDNRRQTAAGTAGVAHGIIFLNDGADKLLIVVDLLQLSVAGTFDHAIVGSAAVLLPGYLVKFTTIDLSTGGTCSYRGAVAISQFDP